MMKRRLLKLALFVLAGAIVNVAVAWGCAVLVPLDRTASVEFDYTRLATQRWLVIRVERTGAIRIRNWPGDPGGVDEPQPAESLAEPWGDLIKARAGIDSNPDTIIDARGWPQPALFSIVDPATGTRDTRFDISWGIPVSNMDTSNGRRVDDFQILPLRPTWPGFAINTFFYAAILWPLFAATRTPRVIRGWRRSRRGLCAACGYPLGTSASCSECGKPVRPKAVEVVA